MPLVACSGRAVSYHAVKRRRVDELQVYEGESGKFALIDVGNDQLVRRSQHGLCASEEFVEVLRRFAALLKEGEIKKEVWVIFRCN